MNDTQFDNLCNLVAWLEQNREFAESHLNMRNFVSFPEYQSWRKHDPGKVSSAPPEAVNDCGTTFCLVGFAAYAGIGNPCNENYDEIRNNWMIYSGEAFGDKIFDAAFDEQWPSDYEISLFRLKAIIAASRAGIFSDFVDRLGANINRYAVEERFQSCGADEAFDKQQDLIHRIAEKLGCDLKV